MSTYSDIYCNVTTDLTGIDPDISAYDRKRVISAWSNVSGSKYISYNTGYIESLYNNGKDLGNPEDALNDVTDEGEWFYDSSTDAVTYYTTTDPAGSGITMKGGEDWTNLKTRIAQQQSEIMRGYINRPIFKRSGTGEQTASGRDYDQIIIDINASLTVAALIKDKDPVRAANLKREQMNPGYAHRGEEPGMMDLIRIGEIKLWNEITVAHQKGLPREVTIGDDSTGTIIDTRGECTTEWDMIKIIIDTGGTVAEGTLNETVIFKSYVFDGSTLKAQLVANDYIDLRYQYIGHGLYIRFGPGVFTTNDEWELEVSGMPEDTASFGSIELVR